MEWLGSPDDHRSDHRQLAASSLLANRARLTENPVLGQLGYGGRVGRPSSGRPTSPLLVIDRNCGLDEDKMN